MAPDARFNQRNITVADPRREPLCPHCGNRLLGSLSYSTPELPLKQCNNCEVLVAQDLDGRWTRLIRVPPSG